MAQTTKQQHHQQQYQRKESQENSILDTTKPPNRIPLSNRSDLNQVTARNQSSITNTLANRSSVSSPQTGSIDNSTASAATTQSSVCNRYQASKVFISKCRIEFESLLDSLKVTYHEDIKNIFNEEVCADLFIQVGEENLKKPLHKCIIASRAYKLYSSLKAFKFIEPQVEENIIISKIQQDLEEEGSASQQDNKEFEDSSTSIESHGCQVERPAVDDHLLPLNCCLPDGLISLELLCNFMRRAYLDQDISEEETNLTQIFTDWLKTNRPEKVRTPVNYLPNHRESFRTIQPDFKDETESRGRLMTPDKSEQMANLCEDSGSNVEDLDENSQATSFRDESLPSSLNRAETFELLNKSNSNSPSVAPSKNILTEPPDNNDNDSDTGNELSNAEESNTPTPYAPTTRTGLKPKTFTTPVGMRTANRNVKGPTTSEKSVSQSPSRDAIIKTKSTNSTVAKTSLNKQPPIGSISTVNPNKRSSHLSEARESKLITDKAIKTTTTTTTAKIGTTATRAGAKSKPTLITRAHPISMERSQSPGTSVIKGTGRNFIESNKKFVSQIERKSSTNQDQGNCESEAEASETSSFLLEPLTSDNLVAQMDKFTLVSCSRLADALSRIFIDEILSDVVIHVKGDKEIRAHQCVLAARSAYFADYIGKQTLPLATSESTLSNTKQLLKINLTEFSYPAVYFCLVHIYSGLVKVPEDLELEELTKLSHLLHVSTLRQVCIHNLRVNYCHFFHKPCNVCCIGVLKTLPIAWRYDYTELYSKCLQWIGSNFANIFCLKEFSELKPNDLIEECYSATINQLTPDNVIPKTIECQKLVKNLPRVKWTEPIICLVGRQLEDFCHYVADNYEKILQSESFLNLGKNCWECEVLEENLLAAMNHLKPDSGCKTLIQLHKIEVSNESFCEDPRVVSDSFSNLILKMRKYCERYLLKDAAAVVHCSSWRHMIPSLQKRIRDQAIISADFDEPTKQLAAKPKLPSMSRVASRKSPSQSVTEGCKSPSNRSTPESKLRSPSTTYLPPPKNKTAAARHVKVLK